MSGSGQLLPGLKPPKILGVGQQISGGRVLGTRTPRLGGRSTWRRFTLVPAVLRGFVGIEVDGRGYRRLLALLAAKTPRGADVFRARVLAARAGQNPSGPVDPLSAFFEEIPKFSCLWLDM